MNRRVMSGEPCARPVYCPPHHDKALSRTACCPPRRTMLFLDAIETTKVLNYSDPEQLAMATTLRDCEVPFKVIGEWGLVAAVCDHSM